MIIRHSASVNNWNQPEILRNAQTLILGSFNPFNPNGHNTDYYYGRSSNYLWKAIATLANMDQNIFQDNTQLKLDFMFEHRFCFLDVIDSIEISIGQNQNEILNDFVERKIYTEFSDQVLFTGKTTFQETPILVRRNYNEDVIDLLNLGDVSRVFHTMGNGTIDANFNTKWKENYLGANGFQGFMNRISNYDNVNMIGQSFSPSGRAVKIGGPNYFINLKNWLNENLQIG
jgi:hypothetical protein